MPASIFPLIPAFSRRVLSRLITAEAEEPDPWLRDDLKIARLTVLHAARGDAVSCAPHVLASYEVLGIHPEKVWPAILARREALGPLEISAAPPKKPAQSVKLWCEKIIGARAANSRAEEATVLRGPRSLPMATASIAALYPNSDAPSSAKKRGFTYDEMLAIVEFSGAPHSVRQGTLSALKARGRWPNENGPATGVVCISLIGMMLHGVCCRSTARWRARRACALGYWRPLRNANSWSDCPKCGAKRNAGTCEQCGYRGRAKTPEGKPNFDEFCRPYMYEIDIEKFRSAERPKEIRHFCARTYAEYKQEARAGEQSIGGQSTGEHANVTEMPRKSPQPSPDPTPLPPNTAAPLPKREKPAAEHSHRSTEQTKPPKMTKRECAKFVADMAVLMKGHVKDGFGWKVQSDDPTYRAPMKWREALAEVCKLWKRTEESVIDALKFWGYQVENSS